MCRVRRLVCFAGPTESSQPRRARLHTDPTSMITLVPQPSRLMKMRKARSTRCDNIHFHVHVNPDDWRSRVLAGQSQHEFTITYRHSLCRGHGPTLSPQRAPSRSFAMSDRNQLSCAHPLLAAACNMRSGFRNVLHNAARAWTQTSASLILRSWALLSHFFCVLYTYT